MRNREEKFENILMSIGEIIIGIILLISPLRFTSFIMILFGLILCIAGIVNIINYFIKTPGEAIISRNLSKGLLGITIGLFIIFKRNWLIAIFPILTTFYGVITLIFGINKIALSVDMIRLKSKKWIWMILDAILTIICSIIIIYNPFSSTAVLWIFIAVSLIAEAIVDIIITLFDKD